jgi:hypothetical protein
VLRGDLSLYEGAQLHGQAHDCPTTLGPVTYRLEAVGPYGTTRASRDLTVVSGQPTPTPVPATVATPYAAPQVVTFNVDPATITAGQCVGIVWSVTNATRVRIRRNASTVLDYAPLAGNTVDCPITPGHMAYRLEAVNASGQSAFADDVVTVTGP